MEVILIRSDGERKTIKIPELPDYPEVLISAGRAFKKHPRTDEYNEVFVWVIPLAESWDFLK
ncbi:hypothetical protein [Nostoc sp.]|uniref:hypothetical protein n=1 Tax=Nostoc sp. TaxID=1180 RepID=UPI002FF58018